MSFLKVQNQTKPIFSKSQIFVQKFNFDKTITFSRFFSSKFFLTIFLVKSKLPTAKKSKTTIFSRVFCFNKFAVYTVLCFRSFWLKVFVNIFLFRFFLLGEQKERLKNVKNCILLFWGIWNMALHNCTAIMPHFCILLILVNFPDSILQRILYCFITYHLNRKW